MQKQQLCSPLAATLITQQAICPLVCNREAVCAPSLHLPAWCPPAPAPRSSCPSSHSCLSSSICNMKIIYCTTLGNLQHRHTPV
ncbi:hypothetical protein FKM82_009101 [Ascaphus truei]